MIKKNVYKMVMQVSAAGAMIFILTASWLVVPSTTNYIYYNSRDNEVKEVDLFSVTKEYPFASKNAFGRGLLLAIGGVLAAIGWCVTVLYLNKQRKDDNSEGRFPNNKLVVIYAIFGTIMYICFIMDVVDVIPDY